MSLEAYNHVYSHIQKIFYQRDTKYGKAYDKSPTEGVEPVQSRLNDTFDYGITSRRGTRYGSMRFTVYWNFKTQKWLSEIIKSLQTTDNHHDIDIIVITNKMKIYDGKLKSMSEDNLDQYDCLY